jgi:hypothetical protein
MYALGVARIRHPGRAVDPLALESAETARLVVGQRTGMVQRAGVDPDTEGADLPRPQHGGRQQVATQTATDVGGQETEVGDLHVVPVLTLQLEVAGRPIGDEADPSLHLRPADMLAPAFVVPAQTFVPAPRATDLLVHGTVEPEIGRIDPRRLHLRRRSRDRTQLDRIPHLQVMNRHLHAAGSPDPYRK